MRFVLLVTLGACAFRISGGDGATSTDAQYDGELSSAQRRVITIPKANLAGTVDDFPVFLDLTLPTAGTTGVDIYFTENDNTTLLDFEIQRWSTSTHQLLTWVRIPQLKSDADEILVVHYGGSSPTASSPASVFSSGFAAVWHLEDAANATTIVDATGMRPGIPQNLPTAASVPAKLGAGLAFDGGAGQIKFVNPLLGSVPHTISAWLDQRTTVDNDVVIQLGTGATNQARWLAGFYDNAGGFAAGFYTNNVVPSPTLSIQNTGPHLLHWVCEGMNKKNRLYVDGVVVANLTLASVNTTVGTDGTIANAPAPFGPTNGMHGTLDEIRIATVMRSDDWIATEAKNQMDPAAFYTVGPAMADR